MAVGKFSTKPVSAIIICLLLTNAIEAKKLSLINFHELSDELFLKYRTGYRWSPPCNESAEMNLKATSLQPAPPSIDWQKAGLTTSVKNQGTCGSCYTFAVTAAIEGQAIKHLGIRNDLSNQQILDCSSPYENLGCEGGFPSASFDYVVKAGGLTAFAHYPYTGREGFCSIVTPLVTVNGHRRYTRASRETLKQILASTGPLVVAIKVIPKTLDPYKGGIYKDPGCKNTSPKDLNHAVTLVGYGTENGEQFWKIKNSWGASWGEQGYFRVSQDYDCGVTLDVYVPGT